MGGEMGDHLIYTHSLGERVQDVKCGCINTPGFEEVVALTYSGVAPINVNHIKALTPSFGLFSSLGKVISFSSESAATDGHDHTTHGVFASSPPKHSHRSQQSSEYADESAVDQLRSSHRIKAVQRELEELGTDTCLPLMVC